MSRRLVVTLFLLFTIGSALSTWRAVGRAIDDETLAQAAVALNAMLRLGVVAAFTVFVATRRPSHKPSREPIALVSCAAAMVAIVLLKRPDGAAETLPVVVGDVVAAAFAAWLLASVLTLGRCFGILPEARGLVTGGPYGLVRHPVYLGELGMAAGLCLAVPGLWNLAVGIVFAAAQWVRMRLEERALTEAFPEYAAYAARTPRLVPRMHWRKRPAVAPAAIGIEAR